MLKNNCQLNKNILLNVIYREDKNIYMMNLYFQLKAIKGHKMNLLV